MVVGSQRTRTVVRELLAAGFAPVRTVGSHTIYVHPSGVRVSVPDGHRTISPGVHRNVVTAVAQAKEAR
jgi:predicted RNA binding protein YcfA (HicA-like mRNA interferase family)